MPSNVFFYLRTLCAADTAISRMIPTPKRSLVCACLFLGRWSAEASGVADTPAFVVSRKSAPASAATPRTSDDRTGRTALRYGAPPEDLYAAIHRKEHEMTKVKSQHSKPSDPVRMALGYAVEGVQENFRLAKALRRVHDDPNNAANPKSKGKSDEERDREAKLLDHGMRDAAMRRGSFVADVKRKSLSRPGETFAKYDDAGMVADAMVSLGSDVVFVNVDYHSYGGDLSELRSAVRAVRSVSDTAAVVMKDIVVDEIQLGLAKEAGADGILLIASVLGPALENFLDQATCMGLETIVECHTRNEVKAALDALAQNILVSNYDRIAGEYHPDQAYKIAGMFPGSGGPIITLAGGGISTTEQMKRL